MRLAATAGFLPYTCSAAGGWSASEVVRDLMRKLQSEPGVLHAWQLLAAPHGSMLSDVLIVQVSTLKGATVMHVVASFYQGSCFQ